MRAGSLPRPPRQADDLGFLDLLRDDDWEGGAEALEAVVGFERELADRERGELFDETVIREDGAEFLKGLRLGDAAG